MKILPFLEVDTSKDSFMKPEMFAVFAARLAWLSLVSDLIVQAKLSFMIPSKVI